ncbi:MAG: DUF302 domain-containing protein [Chromatiaceae bacterium]
MLRRGFMATALVIAALPLHAAPGDGMVVTESPYSVEETTDRAVAAIDARGLKVMARIDHAAGAQAAGLELRPTDLLIFGNPKVGTPLMRCSQTVAIDLPQKLLVWEDVGGTTRIAYNDPAWLDARHDLGDCSKVLDKVNAALKGIAAAASGQSHD